MFSASLIDSFGESVRKFTESLPEKGPIRSKLQGLLPSPEAPVSRNSLLTRAVVQLANEDLTLQQRMIYEDFIAQFPEICQLCALNKKIDSPNIGIKRRIELLVNIYRIEKPPIDQALSILEDLEKVSGGAHIDLSPVLEWIMTGSFPLLDPSQARLFAHYAEIKKMRVFEFTKALPLTASTIRAKALACIRYKDLSLNQELLSYARSLSEEEMLDLLKSDWAKHPSLYLPLCAILTKNFSTYNREKAMELVGGYRNEYGDEALLQLPSVFDVDSSDFMQALDTRSLPQECVINFPRDLFDSTAVDRLFEEVKAGRVRSLKIGYLHDSWFDSLVTRCLNSPLEMLDLPLYEQRELDLVASEVKKARLKKLCIKINTPLNPVPLLQALHRHPTIRELDIGSLCTITDIGDEIIRLWSANPRIRVEASIPYFYLFDEVVARNNPELLRRFLWQVADIPPPPAETDASEEAAETSEELIHLLTERFPQIERASRPGSLRRLNALTPFEHLAPSEIIDLTLLELHSIADDLTLNSPDFSPLFIYVLTGEVPLRLSANQVKVFRVYWGRQPSIPLSFARCLPVKEPFLNEIAAAAVSLRDTDLHRQALTLLQKLSGKRLKSCFNETWAHDSWFYVPLLKLLSRDNRDLEAYLSRSKIDQVEIDERGIVGAVSSHQTLYRGPFGWVQSIDKLLGPNDYPLVSSVVLFEADDEAHSLLKGCENLVRLTVDGVSGEPFIQLLSSLRAERVRELRLLVRNPEETEGIPLTPLKKCAPFLNSLFLTGVSIGKGMVDFITACEHLDELSFSNCSFEEPEALSLAIRCHPSLKSVRLSACMIKEWKMVTDLIEETGLESLEIEHIDLPPLFSRSIENARIKFLDLPALPLGKLSSSIEGLSITAIRSQAALQSVLAAAEGSKTLTSLELHIQFRLDPAFLLAFIERNPQIAVRSSHESHLIEAIAKTGREELLPLVLNPLLR